MTQNKRVALLQAGAGMGAALLAAVPAEAALRVETAVPGAFDPYSDTLAGNLGPALSRVHGDDRYAVMNITIAVPEITTWAMMTAGFALLGGAMRRRTTRRVSFA